MQLYSEYSWADYHSIPSFVTCQFPRPLPICIFKLICFCLVGEGLPALLFLFFGLLFAWAGVAFCLWEAEYHQFSTVKWVFCGAHDFLYYHIPWGPKRLGQRMGCSHGGKMVKNILRRARTELGQLCPLRCSWTAPPIIPAHWSCLLGLMEVGSPATSEWATASPPLG